jgi:hypothetical protein
VVEEKFELHKIKRTVQTASIFGKKLTRLWLQFVTHSIIKMKEDDWWIETVVWQDETAESSIAEKYLSKKKRY